MTRTSPLFISVSTADPRPIGRQIADGIRMAIAARELPAGTMLPSVRGLAQQLSVNPKTVAKAYEDLAAEGWLNARPGLGVLVAEPRQTLSDAERERRMALALDTFSAEVIGLGYPLDHVVDRVRAMLAPMLGKRTA